MTTPKLVLIVDDDPDIRTYLATLLEDHDIGSIEAEDGEDGLEKLATHTPDLITLDVAMPVMSGVGLYRKLRSDDRYKDIPVIMITGVSAEFEHFIKNRNQVPAPDGYIPKPIERDAFLDQVKKILD